VRDLHLGQEIILFFQRFGLIGLIGIVFSNLITSFVIYKVFSIICVNNIHSYKNFLETIIGKNSKLSLVINIIVNSFLLISFYIMLAGFGAYFLQEYGISPYIGATIGGILNFIIFCGDVKWIVKSNQILIPFLILCIILLGIVNQNQIRWELAKDTDILKGVINSITYASYNSILFIPILVSMKDYIKSKKQIKIVSIFSFLIFTMLSLILFFLLNSFKIDSSTIQIPLLYIAGKSGKSFQYLYGGVILTAILTSAISVGYGLLNNISKSKRNYLLFNLILCITSILISQIGFSNLVEILYPLFGYLGLLQIIMVFRKKYCEK